MTFTTQLSISRDNKSSPNQTPQTEEKEECYGTFVSKDMEGASLTELVPEIEGSVNTQEWERNILALEKGK